MTYMKNDLFDAIDVMASNHHVMFERHSAKPRNTQPQTNKPEENLGFLLDRP